MVVYTLYKNPVQHDTLMIVQYLHSIGIDARPSVIYEREYPPYVRVIPSIIDFSGKMWEGNDGCRQFFETCFEQTDLPQKADQFCKNNPGYRIHRDGNTAR